VVRCALKALLTGLWFGIVCPAWAETPAVDEGSMPPDWITGWNVQLSLYTRHWNPSPEHNNHQHMIIVEARSHDNWLVGLSVFDDSFYQPTQLVYVGKT
jgi:hypothetical protein